MIKFCNSSEDIYQTYYQPAQVWQGGRQICRPAPKTAHANLITLRCRSFLAKEGVGFPPPTLPPSTKKTNKLYSLLHLSPPKMQLVMQQGKRMSLSQLLTNEVESLRQMGATIKPSAKLLETVKEHSTPR